MELWATFNQDDSELKKYPKGKVLEFIILRAFELELQNTDIPEDRNTPHIIHSGYVKYPFDVKYPKFNERDCKDILEQIDGSICCDGLYSLIEFKDYTEDKISVEPLAKMRNMLSRRHGSVFGMFFSKTPFTMPAIIQVQFMAPQIILLWSFEEMDFCMHEFSFIECMKWKYSKAIEECEYAADYKVFIETQRKETCPPLF